MIKHKFIYNNTIRQYFNSKTIKIDDNKTQYEALVTINKIVVKITVPSFNDDSIKKIVVNTLKNCIKIDIENHFKVMSDYILLTITSRTESNIQDAPDINKGNMIAESKNKVKLYNIITKINKNLYSHYQSLAAKYLYEELRFANIASKEFEHKQKIDKL